MDDATFDSIFAEPDSSAAEAAPAADAPEADASPQTSETDATATAESPPETSPAAVPAVRDATPTPPATQAVDAAAEPAQPDWHAAENPYRQAAEQWSELQGTMRQAQAMKAQQDIQTAILDLSDGDPERTQRLNALLAHVAAPGSQQAQQQAQRAGNSEKAATALLIAMKAEIPEADQKRVVDRMKGLMALDGPESMERSAFADRDATARFATQFATQNARIALLEKQLAAKAEIAVRGAADRVDGGSGTGGGGTPKRFDNIDDFFASL